MKKVAVLLVLLISGCSAVVNYVDGYGITYNTFPTGANVICDGVNKGYTPITLRYNVSLEDLESKNFKTQPCVAKWASGVSENFSNVWNLKDHPHGVIQTLQRPDEEGYQIDAEFALRVEQLRVEEKQAKALEKQAKKKKVTVKDDEIFRYKYPKR